MSEKDKAKGIINWMALNKFREQKQKELDVLKKKSVKKEDIEQIKKIINYIDELLM